jgi:lysyl endopeptidase
MNRTFRSTAKVLVVVALTLVWQAASAQISFGGRPWALHGEKMGLPTPPVFQLPALDVEALLIEDEQRAADGNKRQRFGINHVTDLSLDNSGSWSTLLNGDRVWRLDIQLEGAMSVNFEFSDYVVPEGAMVYVYTPRGERLGGFNAESNPGRTELGVGLLPGDRITIEYNEPAAVAGQGRLRIGRVTQGYRDSFGLKKGFGESLACNNNVICPEGEPWGTQIRSVARIVVNGGDWCTGSLINNCANDGTPFFLTADHCLGGNVGTWVFAFNWESSSCATNVNTPMNQTVSGAQLLASNPGSDMALLQLNSAPPASYEVYYSGWDASGAIPATQVGIHHPSGDQKKISFNTNASSVVPYGGASCWLVETWEDGTTEGGSSGSGLWDQNGRIVGQLFGGTFGCNCTDYYGQFSVSYPFIDELIGTCGPVLDGYDPNATSFALDGGVQSIASIPSTVCNADVVSPQVTIRNAGTSPLTSLLLSWSVTGGASGSVEWTGSLASGGTAVVDLGAVPVGNGSNTLTVTASLPNGSEDPNAVNNTRTQTFMVAFPGNESALSLVLDDYGSETTWTVTPEGSTTVIASGGPYEDGAGGQVVTTDLCLPDGCYVLTILDDYGDGMCCQYGDGSYELVGTDGMLVTGDGQFTDTIDHTFCFISTGVGSIAGTTLQLRPNPSTGQVEVLLPSGLGDLQVEVVDATGRKVAERRVGAGVALVAMDLNAQPDGVYLVRMWSEGVFLTERLVLQR